MFTFLKKIFKKDKMKFDMYETKSGIFVKDTPEGIEIMNKHLKEVGKI